MEILEQDETARIKKVEWKGADFYHLDHHLAKDMRSFFDMANAPHIFRHDCDGLIMFEENGKKYMFLTELKSNFDAEILYHAKDQIISTFLKANMLLNLSVCYNLKDYVIKGFIVGRPPKPDFKINLHKGSMLSGKKKEREFDLAKKLLILSTTRSITLSPRELYCLHGLPLGEHGIFSKIELHYIAVPEPTSAISLNIHNYI